MKVRRLNLHNYQKDTFYTSVTEAVDTILEEAQVVTSLEVFHHLGMLELRNITRWKQGQVPYLEKVIRCNLSKSKRILTIIRLYATELELRPVLHRYIRKEKKGSPIILQFSKHGQRHVEMLYSTHYVGLKKRIKQ